MKTFNADYNPFEGSQKLVKFNMLIGEDTLRKLNEIADISYISISDVIDFLVNEHIKNRDEHKEQTNKKYNEILNNKIKEDDYTKMHEAQEQAKIMMASAGMSSYEIVKKNKNEYSKKGNINENFQNNN